MRVVMISSSVGLMTDLTPQIGVVTVAISPSTAALEPVAADATHELTSMAAPSVAQHTDNRASAIAHVASTGRDLAYA
jgi:hypothetical protein